MRPEIFAGLIVAALIGLLAMVSLPRATAGSVTGAEATQIGAHLAEVDADKVAWKDKTDAWWKTQLTPLQYQVCREAGTERPFTGRYWDDKEEGVYACSSCGQPLFASKDKFKSGTGWPSYTRPISADAVTTKSDISFGMVRVEALCGRCDAHLGHVFKDGPKPTGERWCINSVCLLRQPE